MNVRRIERFSEQWKSLKAFHDSCCYKGTNLSVAGPGVPNATLTQTVTSSVMGDLRLASLRELHKLEEEIKKEAGV